MAITGWPGLDGPGYFQGPAGALSVAWALFRLAIQGLRRRIRELLLEIRDNPPNITNLPGDPVQLKLKQVDDPECLVLLESIMTRLALAMRTFPDTPPDYVFRDFVICRHDLFRLVDDLVAWGLHQISREMGRRYSDKEYPDNQGDPEVQDATRRATDEFMGRAVPPGVSDDAVDHVAEWRERALQIMERQGTRAGGPIDNR